MKAKSISKVISVLLLALVVGLYLNACSKEEPQAKSEHVGTAKTAKTTAASSSDFNNSLVAFIPDNSLGFVFWEGKSPSYAKFSSSQWGYDGGDMAALAKSSEKQLENFTEVMKKVGLDPTSKKTWESIFSEAVFFVTPAADASKAVALGLLFRSDSSVKLSDLMSLAKAEIGKSTTNKVSELKLAVGTGFSIDGLGAANDPMNKVFIAWNGNTGVVGSHDWVLEKVLSSNGDKLPSLLSTPRFTRATTGFPEAASRFLTGYFDLERAIAEAQQLLPPEAVKQLEAAKFPLKAVSLTSAMQDAPSSKMNFVYDQGDEKANQWLAVLGSSKSTELLTALPSKPLLFLSLDGQTISRVKELALAGLGENGKMLQPQFSILDSIKRIGLVVRVAPAGQSLMPLPDVMLVVEANDATKVKDDLQQLVAMGVKSSGVPGGMDWTDKKIENTPVKAMLSPMGFGVFMASSKNLVIITSTEPQMQVALSSVAGAGNQSFAKTMSLQAEQVFAKNNTLGNLYLNFEELGSAMETMGGLLSMYIPQNEEVGKMLKPESIQALKKKGSVVGSVTVDQGMIGFDSFYQPST